MSPVDAVKFSAITDALAQPLFPEISYLLTGVEKIYSSLTVNLFDDIIGHQSLNWPPEISQYTFRRHNSGTLAKPQTRIEYKLNQSIELTTADCPSQKPDVCHMSAEVDMELLLPDSRPSGANSDGTRTLNLSQTYIKVNTFKVRNQLYSVEIAKPGTLLQFASLRLEYDCRQGGCPILGELGWSGDNTPLTPDALMAEGLSTQQSIELTISDLKNADRRALGFVFAIPSPTANIRIDHNPAASRLQLASAQVTPWELSGHAHLVLDNAGLRAGFSLEFAAADVTQTWSALARDFSALWINNPSWNPLTDKISGVIDLQVMRDNEEILAIHHQLLAAATERNQYDISHRNVDMDHFHERDLTGAIGLVQGQDKSGLQLEVSQTDGAAQGTVKNDRGETLAQIISDSYGGWVVQFLE